MFDDNTTVLRSSRHTLPYFYAVELQACSVFYILLSLVSKEDPLVIYFVTVWMREIMK